MVLQNYFRREIVHTILFLEYQFHTLLEKVTAEEAE